MSVSTRNSTAKHLTGDQFATWLKTRELSVNDAADFLGVTTSSVRWYLKNGLSKTQALAVSAIERGLVPWKPTEAEEEKAKSMEIPKPKDKSET